jgi:hypothetical protein
MSSSVFEARLFIAYRVRMTWQLQTTRLSSAWVKSKDRPTSHLEDAGRSRLSAPGSPPSAPHPSHAVPPELLLAEIPTPEIATRRPRAKFGARKQAKLRRNLGHFQPQENFGPFEFGQLFLSHRAPYDEMANINTRSHAERSEGRAARGEGGSGFAAHLSSPSA